MYHQACTTTSVAWRGAQVRAAGAAYEELRLHDALEAALAIAGRGNLYMEEVAPWTALKKARARPGRLSVLHVRRSVRRPWQWVLFTGC